MSRQLSQSRDLPVLKKPIFASTPIRLLVLFTDFCENSFYFKYCFDFRLESTLKFKNNFYLIIKIHFSINLLNVLLNYQFFSLFRKEFQNEIPSPEAYPDPYGREALPLQPVRQ